MQDRGRGKYLLMTCSNASKQSKQKRTEITDFFVFDRKLGDGRSTLRVDSGKSRSLDSTSQTRRMLTRRSANWNERSML